MKKIAIFVEGQTEQLFVCELIKEIAGINNLKIELRTLTGGANIPRHITQCSISDSSEKVKFYILITNSATDNRVASDIRDNTETLINQNFDRIIGLRDLYPLPLEKLEKLQNGINKTIKSEKIHTNLIIAIREIESWFLAEFTHFEKIDTNLCLCKILSELELDIAYTKTESIEHPSKTLDEIYSLIGESYGKSKADVLRTLEKLDYNFLYLELTECIPALKELTDEVDSFLANE